MQADSLPGEPKGKSKNIRVGRRSLFPGIFPTQESNQGLLQCRWILSQLSHQGALDEVVPAQCATMEGCSRHALGVNNKKREAVGCMRQALGAGALG